jgi:hypothetical protein
MHCTNQLKKQTELELNFVVVSDEFSAETKENKENVKN